nr:sigma-70 family RNA polymerase sigma factor [Galbitalea soli]
MVARVAAGDHAAFEALYETVATRVLATVRRQLVDLSQSEEVAQEVFLEIWQSAARFQPARGAALSWILTMAARRAIDRIRASQASRDRDRVTGLREQSPPHDEVWEHVAARADRDTLTTALALISPLQREALTITYLDGRTAAEAAALVGASTSAVKTRQRDGLLRLRQLLGADQALSA